MTYAAFNEEEIPCGLAHVGSIELRNRIAAWQAEQEREPRPMPEDFAPDLMFEDGKVIAQVAGAGTTLGLAFIVTGDPHHDGRLMHAFREAIWQVLELVRLGRADELRRMGVL